MSSRLLRRARGRLYTGPIKRIVRQLSLNEYLSGLYWELVFALADDMQTQSIADQTVLFHTATFDEFLRLRDLVDERPILEDLLQSLKPSDVFYGVGAKVGTYTCFAASKLGPNAVVAFEPERKSATRLRENLDLSDLDAQVVENALSDINETFNIRELSSRNEFRQTVSRI